MQKVARKILSLDRERSRWAIKYAMGKWGAGWVLEVMAEIYDAIVELEHSDWCDKENAAVRAKLLRALSGNLFNCVREEENREQEIHDSERVVEIKTGGTTTEQKNDG